MASFSQKYSEKEMSYIKERKIKKRKTKERERINTFFEGEAKGKRLTGEHLTPTLFLPFSIIFFSFFYMNAVPF